MMVQVIVICREIGSVSPDWSLQFDLPEVPAEGAYLSITRPGDGRLHSEDLIVRHVWWRLAHPEADAVTDSDNVKVGSVVEIFVECDVAEGPYATDRWKEQARRARERGHEIPRFEIGRFSISQAALRGDDD